MMSALSRGLSSKEEWQDFVAWDGDELYDPLFQGDNVCSGTSELESYPTGYDVPESVNSDYVPSAPTSVVDGPSSFEYTTSAPPSITDDPPSSGQTFSLLSTSPSFSTDATSPLAARFEWGHAGSGHTSEHGTFHLDGNITESPLLDTGEQFFPASVHSANSISTASTYLFNPFVAGSPHAFSSLDVNASQALANVGTWQDQPQIIEPIPEFEHSHAIPIPHSVPSAHQGFGFSHQAQATSHREQPRAITIPQPGQRPASYNSDLRSSHWASRVPPALSVSPDARRPRSFTLSRSLSRTESRRSRNSLNTPSPTSNTFGWVAYQHDRHNNKLVPSGTDGSKRQRGRTKGLTSQQRRDAALMRVLKACSNCRRRKEKCDPGIPCKACLAHFKGDLVNHPCRERLLSDLSTTFLSDRLGWHPTNRTLESFIPLNGFGIITGINYTIPLHLGFGSVLRLPVHPLQVEDQNVLYHNHMVYDWPPNESTGETHTHAVLPAVLTSETLSNLSHTLDTHLSLLVSQHFRSFPLYCSPLRILRDVYVYFRSLPTNALSTRLLHQALKLLVLVHIGGDLTLPTPSSDPILAQLTKMTMAELHTDGDEIVPTPCFLRSQLGGVMPTLALSLMRQVLVGLERMFLDRECSEWPKALAVLIVVLMTIESIHYHAAKLPYHHPHDANFSPDPASAAQDRQVDDEGIEYLFKFYSTCFSGCHARLHPDWKGEASFAPGMGATGPPSRADIDDKFIENVREAAKRASARGYLKRKAMEERHSDQDMGFFFDRLVAKLLILDI